MSRHALDYYKDQLLHEQLNRTYRWHFPEMNYMRRKNEKLKSIYRLAVLFSCGHCCVSSCADGGYQIVKKPNYRSCSGMACHQYEYAYAW